jgi:hypothetical protein
MENTLFAEFYSAAHRAKAEQAEAQRKRQCDLETFRKEQAQRRLTSNRKSMQSFLIHSGIWEMLQERGGEWAPDSEDYLVGGVRLFFEFPRGGGSELWIEKSGKKIRVASVSGHYVSAATFGDALLAL